MFPTSSLFASINIIVRTISLFHVNETRRGTVMVTKILKINSTILGLQLLNEYYNFFIELKAWVPSNYFAQKRNCACFRFHISCKISCPQWKIGKQQLQVVRNQRSVNTIKYIDSTSNDIFTRTSQISCWKVMEKLIVNEFLGQRISYKTNPGKNVF